MQKILPCLWFDGNGENALSFYQSVFKDTKILSSSRYGENAPGTKGTLMTAIFEVHGQQLMILNGGPMYKLTPAFSLLVNCETQDEVDTLWTKLTADGGAPSRCGWLTDKFGVSWQIVPTILGQLMQDKNPKKAGAVMSAMLKMDKLIIKDLKAAYESV